VTLALAGLAAHAIRATGPRDAEPLGLSSAALAPDGTAYEDVEFDADFLDALRPREALFRTYDPEADAPVWVFLSYFDRQKEGSQVHSPRHCYPGSGWSIEREFEHPVAWRAGTVHGIVVSNGEEKRLVCYWYQTPAGIVADALPLKFALLRQAVAHGTQDVVFANVSTPMTGDEEAAFARVEPFARAAETQIARLYRERNERHSHSL
jgi:EpsI family protein